MSAAAILAIVVATGEASNPTTTALVATAAEALGAATAIRLVESADPAAVDAHAIERELGAGAVVAVVWAEQAGAQIPPPVLAPTQSHTRALLLLHVASTDAWTRRTMTFAASDALAERGRMLGFAVGSMWPESQGTTEPAAPAATDATPKTPPAPAAPSPSPSSSSPPSPPASALTAASASSSSPPSRKFAVVVAGLGALGAGDGLAFGGNVAGVWVLAPAWALRLGLGVRSDDVPALPGAVVIGSLGAGVEWWPAWAVVGRARPAGDAPLWRTGLRADALAVGQWVRYSPPDDSESQRRMLPGADLALQSAVALGGRVELRVAVGAELSLGKTDLRRGDARTTVATIPAAQMLAEMGVAIAF